MRDNLPVLPAGVQWGRDFRNDEKIAGHFTSMKTCEPIAFRRRWHRDGLRALSLDPKVKRMAAYSGPETPPEGVETLISVRLPEGVVVVGFALQPASRFLLGSMPFRVLTRAEIEKEPRATTIRELWSTRDAWIDPADRVRLLTAIGAAGGAGVQLGDLLELVRYPDTEAVHGLLRLACDGEVEIDMGGRICPETTVWRAGKRAAAPTADASMTSPKPPLATEKVARFPPVAECRTHESSVQGRPKKPRIKARDRRQGELLLPITTGPQTDSFNDSMEIEPTPSALTRRIRKPR